MKMLPAHTMPAHPLPERSTDSLEKSDVRAAANQFESLLLGELYKVMRNTVPESSMFGSMSNDVFTGMLDESSPGGHRSARYR